MAQGGAAQRKRPRAVEIEQQPAHKKPRAATKVSVIKPKAKTASTDVASAATKQKQLTIAIKPSAKGSTAARTAKNTGVVAAAKKPTAPAAAGAKKPKALTGAATKKPKELSAAQIDAAQREAKKASEAKKKARRKYLMEIMPKKRPSTLEHHWTTLGLTVHEKEDPSSKGTIVDLQRKYWTSFQKAMISEHGRKDAVDLERDLRGGKQEGEVEVSMRPDRVATKWFSTVSADEWPGKKAWQTREKCWGYFPGVCTNDKFYNRAEMSVLGMHRPPLAGIDYMTSEEVLKRTNGAYDIPVATSVVFAGNYADDKDGQDTCTYTGQGGNDLLGNKKQVKDQEFEYGNLALAGNVETGIPVRVCRKNEEDESCYGVVYTFDGLYSVDEWYWVRGKEGFVVFQYKLRRLPGQAPLLSHKVDFGGVKSVPLKITPTTRHGIICLDLSKGLEPMPVMVVNTVDQELPPGIDPDNESDAKFLVTPDSNKKLVKSSAPYSFRYIVSAEYDSRVPRPTIKRPATKRRGQAADAFLEELHAELALLNGGTLPFHHGGKAKGAMNAAKSLVKKEERAARVSKCEPKALLFECGSWCGCPHGNACIQAPTAVGLRYRVEVFKTGDERGWGVRCWDTIPAGAVVCAFIGKIYRSEDCHGMPPDYHFDMAPRPAAGVTDPPEPKYFVDSREAGNWSRFINHSCDPNLYVQPSCAGHHDADYPTITFVAWRNIPPLTELSYDYGNSYVDLQLGNNCMCGASSCRSNKKKA